MKIRSGFVSNSSSLSYICSICDHEIIISDMDDPNEYGFSNCENGHYICEKHFRENLKKLTKEQYIKWVRTQEWYKELSIEKKNYEEDDWKDGAELLLSEYGDVCSFICPICQFQSFDPEDIKKYFIKMGLDSEIQQKIKTYKEFKDFIKN